MESIWLERSRRQGIPNSPIGTGDHRSGSESSLGVTSGGDSARLPRHDHASPLRNMPCIAMDAAARNRFTCNPGRAHEERSARGILRLSGLHFDD
jgi:hypothetical protein